MTELQTRLEGLSPERRKLLERLRGAAPRADVPALRARPRPGAAAPLSHAQRQLWVIERMHPGGAAYAVARALRIRGPLDVAALERALGALRARHETLRTTFAEREGGPVQVVHPPISIPLPVEDLSALGEDAREAEARRRVDADANTGFDLESGPVFRARLLRLAEDEHVLLLAMHHVATDGWSTGVMQRELGELYAAFAEGRPDPLVPLALQYADYALWQDEWLRGERLERHLAFWRRALEGAPPALELPTDRPRPAVESHRGERARWAVPAALAEQLREVGRAEGGTLFHVLLAALRLVLSRHAGQDEVVIGTPFANRGRTEVEPLVGFFVNLLPLLTAVPGDPAFRALVAAERDAALAAFGHQELPFDRLVEELRLPRDPGRNPVFQAVMTLQNARMELPDFPGCAVEALDARIETAQFDLTFDTYEEADGGLRLEVSWATDLFDATTVRRIVRHYLGLLENAAAAPDTPRSRLEMADAVERAFVVEACNRTRTDYERDTTVHALVARQAARTPDAIAVESGDVRLTFAELDARAGRLARRLAAAGAGPEARVGVAMERSAELVVALLAVFKAGAAYVPLDVEYPPERLAFMVADSGISVLVVGDEVPSALAGYSGAVVRAGAGVESPDLQDGDGDTVAVPTFDVGPEDLAYVTYTSGSTGTPKAVMVPHRGVVRLVRGTDYAELGAGETFLLLAALAFDPSLMEIWAPLVNGGRLVVAPPRQPSLREIGALIEEKGVTTLWLTSGLFHRMVDEEIESLGHLRQLLAGGDVLSVAHVERVLEAHPRLRVINGYGPTENTTYSCCHTVVPDDTAGPSVDTGRPVARSRVSIPIGRPIANSTAYVLDRHGRPCPLGVPGELYAGGDGVARGYLGRPGLTAERFVPDPFSDRPGARLYRTGDRVRRREDGTLEFLGRIDQQVKVRGFRVEPGEIEAALKQHPAVGDALVIARADGGADKRLVAYVVPRNGSAPGAAELRTLLAARLPAHLVPSAYVVLDAIPLTPNGKPDRRALPAPEAEADAYVPPRTPAEEMLAGIFAALLGVERVGAEDDFFRLGGHSLLATQMASRIRRAFGVDLPLWAVFEAGTPRALAAHVEAAAAGAPEPLPPMEPIARGGALPLSFAQERLWFLERLLPGRGLYNMPVRHRLEGTVDADALRRALTAVVARHEALRARYREADGAPVQEIAAPWEIDLPVVPVAGDDDEEAWLAAEAFRPFDLERGPLLRAALLRRGEREHVLALNVHHSVGDGWSWGLLLRDLSDAYAAALRGDDPHLPPLELQYADFAAWQRGWLAGDRLESQLAYWRAALEGAPALLELPTDRPRPALPANRGALLPFSLTPGLTRRVHALAAHEGATLFMTLLAAFQAVLARWSGQRDVVVGSPIAGRHHGEAEEIAGFFVNTLPLRARLEDDPSFRALLARVRGATLDAYAHQDLPFERMVEELRVERSLSHGPVFQVLFGLQNLPPAALRLDGVRAEEMEVSPRAAKFDLSFELREADGRVAGAIEYDADLFDAATVERLAAHFRHLLDVVCADPDAHPLRVDLLTDADRERLEAWSRGPAHAGGFVPLPRAFAARAAAQPDAPAIRFRGETITYGALDARANGIARRLRALGAGPDARVGVCLPRTPDAIAAMLGVMKGGAAYIPLDPAYPSARLATVLADADAVAVITTGEIAGRLPDHLPALVLDEETDAGTAEDPNVSIDPSSLAYVLFTSGSTGTPKGVMVEHGAVAHLLEWTHATLAGEERAAVLASTSFSFDVSVAEVFGTLCRGGTLVLVENALDVAGDEVRSAYMVPTAAAELLRLGALPAGLTTLNLGGEALPGALVDQLLATETVRTVRNLYGPTEVTVYAAWAEVEQGDARPAIGRPVADTRAYVLDEWMRPVPAGLPGELYLGGAGVARGYANRPALTAERFAPDPFSVEPGARMYRTGDRARWRETEVRECRSAEVRDAGAASASARDQRTRALTHSRTGVLEYLGRLDQQVKLRGFRIEPGEVESALLAHPGVAEAVAIVRHDGGDARLVAYVVAAAGGAAPEPAELRAHLRERLPDYMVPGAFVALDAFPLTGSGKVDRRALPAPAAAAGAARPWTDTERALAAVWRELLDVPHVSPGDSFFALGGHSLAGMRLVAAMQDRLDVTLPLRDVFDFPRLADLAARVDRLRARSLDALLEGLGMSEEEARAALNGRLSDAEVPSAEHAGHHASTEDEWTSACASGD
ncbi:MAG TPA: amino acid adenylation domain-containing protein [Longimicrobium sp.]